jgi:2-dehydro-3-deoxygalactonokinase
MQPMKRYITIDGGTTNTRVSLIADKECLHTLRLSIGARACIDQRAIFENCLKEAIDEILARFKLRPNDIECILASGMITSELGLLELPHLEAPAGISELHSGIATASFENITPIPFVFIRGVKTAAEELTGFDMMRGEETELMGLISMGYGAQDCVYVLPGSHSKIVSIDHLCRISSFCTMLTGEMIMALSQNTILKDAIDLGITDYDANYLEKGYRFAKDEGINKALFKVRILKNKFKATPKEVCSFFIGAILCDEIEYILSSGAENIIIGGNKIIKIATAILLRRISDKQITIVPDSDVERSTAIGAIRIFEAQY